MSKSNVSTDDIARALKERTPMAASPNSNERISCNFKRAVVTAGMPYGTSRCTSAIVAAAPCRPTPSRASCATASARQRALHQRHRLLRLAHQRGLPQAGGGRRVQTAPSPSNVERNHEAEEHAERLRHQPVHLRRLRHGIRAIASADHREVHREAARGIGTCSAEASPCSTMRKRARSSTAARWSGAAPVQGCKSEHAYADECAPGAQLRPRATSSRRSRR